MSVFKAEIDKKRPYYDKEVQRRSAAIMSLDYSHKVCYVSS
jgi:hypothetical protein